MLDKTYEGWGKYNKPDEIYFQYIDKLEKMQHSTKDLIYNFPVFVGQVNLARFLFFYDLYKQVINLNGHIADVGTYKGASMLFFAKLIKLFEPYNTTQVHGFDWFQGMKTGEKDNIVNEGLYVASYENLMNLIEIQDLSDVSILHNINLITELEDFMRERPYLRFKIVFVDCGIAEVMEKALFYFWPKLVNGGILIMDHFNCETSPSESEILERYIGNNLIQQMPFNRQPTCYVVKNK